MVYTTTSYKLDVSLSVIESCPIMWFFLDSDFAILLICLLAWEHRL